MEQEYPNQQQDQVELNTLVDQTISSDKKSRILLITFCVVGGVLLIIGGFFWYTRKVITSETQFPVIIDTDNDLLSDEDEKKYGTDLNNSDTDGDGVDDGIEIKKGMDPKNPRSLSSDKDDAAALVDQFQAEEYKARQKYLEQNQQQ